MWISYHTGAVGRGSRSEDILANHDDFLTPVTQQECQQYLPDASKIEPKRADIADWYLRSHVNRSVFSVL